MTGNTAPGPERPPGLWDPRCVSSRAPSATDAGFFDRARFPSQILWWKLSLHSSPPTSCHTHRRGAHFLTICLCFSICVKVDFMTLRQLFGRSSDRNLWTVVRREVVLQDLAFSERPFLSSSDQNSGAGARACPAAGSPVGGLGAARQSLGGGAHSWPWPWPDQPGAASAVPTPFRGWQRHCRAARGGTEIRGLGVTVVSLAFFLRCLLWLKNYLLTFTES